MEYNSSKIQGGEVNALSFLLPVGRRRPFLPVLGAQKSLLVCAQRVE